MTLLTNARLVLADTIVRGTLRIEDGLIAAIDDGPSASPGAIDCDGDLILPGIVDLHTDNLERQVMPRSGARWPSRSAMLAHDAQCAGAGVTTVFDALCVGDLYDAGRHRTFVEGVADAEALAGTGLLKAEHCLHLRCELPAADMIALFAPLMAHTALRMVSLMDHVPGAGQHGDLDRYRAMRRREGWEADAIEHEIVRLRGLRDRNRAPNRRALLELLAGSSIVIARHDDGTEAEIAINHADGITISEFPVAMEAALAARACGMRVIAGAPNIVRGGSHSGNVSASALVEAGAVDAFASDYVPGSLLEAAFLCAERLGLPASVRLITAAPAGMAGLADRGALAVGLRADVLRVRVHEGLPVVRAVWRAGERVS